MINRKKEPSAELTKTMEEELQDLYRYAFYRLGDEQDAEDIIQDPYISIHEKQAHPHRTFISVPVPHSETSAPP